MNFRYVTMGFRATTGSLSGARVFYETTEHGEPGFADAKFVRRVERWLGPWARLWFRPSLEGIEHLPESGPYLIVANHSGGGVAEVMCLVLMWWDRFRTSRPLAGFAHPIAFHMPLLSYFVKRLGIIPSTYAAADRALEAGVPILLFPGGDHEGFRPIWQANVVDFAGRKGFLKIAQKHGVPVVPLAISGSHVTNPILWRSSLFAWILVWPRLAGVKRVPVTALAAAVCVLVVVGTHVALGPWIAALAGWLSWTVIPSSFVPWVPSRIRMRLLPAVRADGDLDLAYARITGDLALALGARLSSR